MSTGKLRAGKMSPQRYREQQDENRYMSSFRVTLAAGILAAVMCPMSPAQSSRDILRPTQAAASSVGLHDFDFLLGEWSVRHRRLKPDSNEWVEFDGTCSNRALMKGQANMEEHLLNSPTGAYRAIALRSYNSKAGEWAIWWLDGRYPSGPLDPPVKGRFETGIGSFYSDYMNNGKPMRVRFIWSHITATSARWEQSISADAGKTWATNWVMEFRRKADPGASAGQAQSRVDWGEVAEIIVKRALELAPGERVALFSDDSSDRGATKAIRAAIASAGAVAIEANVPSMADFELSKRLSPSVVALQLAQRDSLWADAFSDIDAVIWLASPLTSMPGRPIEHLVERTRVRSVHFHWPLPADTADVPWVEERYARALAVQPALLNARMAALESMLRGATVKVTSPNGTNYTFKVAPNAWVHRNTGDASRAKVATARSIRDREEELPAGALRTTDVSEGAGTLVGYAGYSTHAPIIQATFENGRITRFESRRGAEANVAAWREATGDKFVQGDFILGINPELPAVSPSGFIPYYGYGAGVVRIVIGDNWESGGKNRSSNGETPFLLVDATVEVNGRVLIKDGKLIAP